jgi:hypothetical protein
MTAAVKTGMAVIRRRYRWLSYSWTHSDRQHEKQGPEETG